MATCNVCGADEPEWTCPYDPENHHCCKDCLNSFARARYSEGYHTVPCPCGAAECGLRVARVAHALPPETNAMLAELRKPPPADGARTSLATRLWRLRHTQRCRKCKAYVEKNGGCNHMTCRCGHEFCWRCGGDWGMYGHDFILFPWPSEYAYACKAPIIWVYRFLVVAFILPICFLTLCKMVYDCGSDCCEALVERYSSWSKTRAEQNKQRRERDQMARAVRESRKAERERARRVERERAERERVESERAELALLERIAELNRPPEVHHNRVTLV